MNFEGRPGLRKGPLGNWVVPVSRHKLHACLGTYIWRRWAEQRREEKCRRRVSQVVCSIHRRKGRLLRAKTSKEDLRWRACPLCTSSDFN